MADRWLSLAIALWLLCAGGALAGDSYCGLYSVHAALHAIKIDAELPNIVRAENLSGSSGSTADDLIRVARDHGAATQFRSDMTLAALRALDGPAILHSSVAVADSGFHHWILFLGMEGEQVRIYDPPHQPYLATIPELLSIWDGRAIVVSRPGAPIGTFAWPLELVLAVLLALAAVVAGKRIDWLRQRPMISLAAASFVGAVAWHAITDLGFLRDVDGRAIIASRHQQYDVPLIAADSFDAAIKADDAFVIDARLPADYRQLHIPGAVNLPVLCTLGDIRRTLAKAPQDCSIIIYCQSNRCRWADLIAQQICARGFRRVSLYRDGMEGWKQSHAGVEEYASSLPENGDSQTP